MIEVGQAGVANSPFEMGLPIAREAIDTALQQADAFRAVAASAWPVRAVVERNQTAPLALWLRELVARSRRIENPVSRFEALFVLWQAAFPFNDPETDRIFDEFLRACESANSWKVGPRMADSVHILASRDPGRAAEIAASMRDGKNKQRALQRLSESACGHPRPFFWIATTR